MPEDERMKTYIAALAPSVLRKYRVRRVFGTHRRAGSAFGRGVPALVVWDEIGDIVADVYPHEEAGRIITICDFLTQSSKKHQQQAMKKARNESQTRRHEGLRLSGRSMGGRRNAHRSRLQ
jgi:hypothetical protein